MQLYIEGNVDLLYTNMISIIGSRHCSENGIKLAKKFTKELAYQNMTIVSGMAKGIDTVVHQTTLEEKGRTIAVLGNGLNHIYPVENKELYKQILQNHGLVVTEYKPEEEAKSSYFLERNRIVSGLSLGILVIEATHRSGTSVTAKFAQEQGKKVFTIPHEISDIHGVGTNRLIKEGAILVTSSEDIIKEFPFLIYQPLPKEKKEQATLCKARKICKNKELNEIYQFITNKTISIDEIYHKSNKTITEINHILFMLEVNGYIQKVAGGYQCILDKK